MKEELLAVIRRLINHGAKQNLDSKHRNRPGQAGLWILIAAITGITLVVSSCSTSSTSVQSPQPAKEQQSNGSPQAGLTRTQSSGEVTIEATLRPRPSRGATRLSFSIDMNTHSVDLDQVDLNKLSLLRDNSNRTYKPSSWKAPPGGHHRAGILTFDGSQPLVDEKTTYIELVINDLAGIKERVLQWDISQLMSGNTSALNRNESSQMMPPTEDSQMMPSESCHGQASENYN